MDEIVRGWVQASKGNTLHTQNGFGKDLTFSINGDDKYKTKLGFLYTVLYYVLLGLIFWYYLVIFFNTKDPDVESSNVRNNSHIEVDLMENQFYQVFIFMIVIIIKCMILNISEEVSQPQDIQ